MNKKWRNKTVEGTGGKVGTENRVGMDVKAITAQRVEEDGTEKGRERREERQRRRRFLKWGPFPT